MIPTMESIESQVKEYGADAINWKLVARYVPKLTLDFIEKYKDHLDIKDIFDYNHDDDCGIFYHFERVNEEVIRKYVKEGGDLDKMYSYRGPIPSDIVDMLIDHYFDSMNDFSIYRLNHFADLFEILRDDNNVDHLLDKVESLPDNSMIVHEYEIEESYEKREYFLTHTCSPWMKLSDEKIESILFDNEIDDHTLEMFVMHNIDILSKESIMKILSKVDNIRSFENVIYTISKSERFDIDFFMDLMNDLMEKIDDEFKDNEKFIKDIKKSIVESLLFFKNDIPLEFYDKYIHYVLDDKGLVTIDKFNISANVIKNIRKYNKDLFMKNTNKFIFSPFYVIKSFDHCPEDNDTLEEVINYYISVIKNTNKKSSVYKRNLSDFIKKSITEIFTPEEYTISEEFKKYVADFLNKDPDTHYYDYYYEKYYYERVPLDKETIRKSATAENFSFDHAINNYNTDTDLYIECLRNNKRMINLFKTVPGSHDIEDYGALVNSIYISMGVSKLDYDRIIKFLISFIDELNENKNKTKPLKRMIVNLFISTTILKLETMNELIDNDLVSWFAAMIFYPEFEKISDRFPKYSNYINFLYRKTINFNRDIAILNPCNNGVKWYKKRFKLDEDVPYSEIVRRIINEKRIEFILWYYNAIYFYNSIEFLTDFNIEKAKKIDGCLQYFRIYNDNDYYSVYNYYKDFSDD